LAASAVVSSAFVSAAEEAASAVVVSGAAVVSAGLLPHAVKDIIMAPARMSDATFAVFFITNLSSSSQISFDLNLIGIILQKIHPVNFIALKLCVFNALKWNFVKNAENREMVLSLFTLLKIHFQ
jgi:hypothetical protein